MRVAIYTRLSPNPYKVDTINQERDLTEFARRNSWEIIKIYTDIHVSGSKKGKERSQFSEMMNDASQRKFDLVLFWALDRLSREGAFETLQYLKQLDSWGVGFRSYTEQYLDSCGMFKDAVIAIMGVVAKQERCRLVDRTLAGLATAKANGKKLGRAYCTTKTPTRPNPVDMNIVQRMRVQGKSMKEIGKRFGASESTISRMLKKEKHVSTGIFTSIMEEANKTTDSMGKG